MVESEPRVYPEALLTGPPTRVSNEEPVWTTHAPHRHGMKLSSGGCSSLGFELGSEAIVTTNIRLTESPKSWLRCYPNFVKGLLESRRLLYPEEASIRDSATAAPHKDPGRYTALA